jgi:hypothetical protein
MVNIKKSMGAAVLVALPAVLSASATAAADSSVFHPVQSSSVLSRALGADYLTGATGPKQVQSATTLSILGSSLQALNATIGVPDTVDGTTYSEYYSFGFRVFSQSFYFTNNGILQADVGLAPTEIRVPFVVYPVGPVTFQIDGGVRFQADLQEQLMPTIILDSSLSSLAVKLSGKVTGSGFIEGVADAVALRAGVGGQLNLVDAQADAMADFFFDGRSPTTQISGFAQFLNGRLYAFADVFDVFEWNWLRFWNYDLFNWSGYCYSTGNTACPAQ